jgi:hypothetical protein
MRSLKFNLISWVLLETMSTASDKRKRTRHILSLLTFFRKERKEISACVYVVYKREKYIYRARQMEWENEKLTGTVCSGRRLRLHTTGNTNSALTTRSKGRCRVARPAPRNVQGCNRHCSPAFCGERVEFYAANKEAQINLTVFLLSKFYNTIYFLAAALIGCLRYSFFNFNEIYNF